jgi:hypothetical protein
MTKAEPSPQKEGHQGRGAALLTLWGTEGVDPAYLAKWARKVSRALSRGTLERLRGEYVARARDKRLSKEDRAVSRRRAAAIGKYV